MILFIILMIMMASDLNDYLYYFIIITACDLDLKKSKKFTSTFDKADEVRNFVSATDTG
jgi:hypothetical protein